MEKLELVIFDMDGTLYKFKGSGKDNAIYQTDFYREVKDRGIKFLIEKLNITEREAIKVREDTFKKYKGDVSIGLEREYGIDRYEYFKNVWNIKAEKYIKPDPRLRNVLEKIYLKKAILTTAPRIWTINALKQIDIERLFDGIWTGESDIRKPKKEAYLQVINKLNVLSQKSVMVDDEAKYLLPAKQLGMLTVLIGNERKKFIDFNLKSIYDIDKLIKKLISN